MSYSVDLKNNLIASILADSELKKAELGGILTAMANIRFLEDSIAFSVKTENAKLARYIFEMIEDLYNVKARIEFTRAHHFSKHRTYILNYDNGDPILFDTGVLVRRKDKKYYNAIINTIFFAEEKYRRAFLRGVFLASGSIADPQKAYHLEIDLPNIALTESFAEILEDYDVTPHIINKKNYSVLYLKDSQDISDFLALIGASKAVLDYEQTKVINQMRGEINRQVNCETANMNKTAQAAGEQLEAIGKLRKSGSFDKLPPDLKAVAELRESYPMESVRVLAQKNSAFSTTTLYRKLKRLVELGKGIQ